MSKIPENLLDAIVQVESGGNPKAVGDGGKAIGAFQIHRSYWKDAVAFDKTLGGTYNDCFDPAYARRVVIAYMSRYAPPNATLEQLARIHNGGCNILKKRGTKAWDNTTAYWNKVRKHL
jgi:soluble lytic murein transglycosylase-like protein